MVPPTAFGMQLKAGWRPLARSYRRARRKSGVGSIKNKSLLLPTPIIDFLEFTREFLHQQRVSRAVETKNRTNYFLLTSQQVRCGIHVTMTFSGPLFPLFICFASVRLALGLREVVIMTMKTSKIDQSVDKSLLGEGVALSACWTRGWGFSRVFGSTASSFSPDPHMSCLIDKDHLFLVI